MLTIDDTGMPCAPTLRQLLNKDIRELYKSDTSPDKSRYIQDCIVIYYLGDPKSPPHQAGLSEAEAFKMAIEQAGLPKDYRPTELVIKLIKKYYEENITEAGRVIENILKCLHNVNLSIDAINNVLNQRLAANISISDVNDVLELISKVNAQTKELPTIFKRLEEAKENFLYDTEKQKYRGGQDMLSSMDAETYSE